jgi:uncharacterized protein (DUF58 family)
MNLRQNALVLLALTMAMAIVGEWLPDSAAARLWALPAALLLLGLAYERWVTHSLRLRMWSEAPTHWLLAKASMMNLLFAHEARREISLLVAPHIPHALEADTALRSVAIPAAGVARLELPVTGKRLGQFPLPAQPVRVAGPLGLAYWSLNLTDVRIINVVPGTLDMHGVGAGIAGAGARVAGRIGTGLQLEQLRDYRPDDPLRSVDWKATARRGKLVSRDYSDDQRLDVVIALDAGRSSAVMCGELDRLGHYVNITARLVQHAAGMDDRVGLVIFGDRPLAIVPPARGQAAVARVRTLLGRVEVQSTDSNAFNAALQIRRHVKQRSLVILLTDIEDAASSSQLVTAVRLLQPKHLPLVVGLVSEELENGRDRPARNWLDPYFSLAASIQTQRRDRSVRALRSLGAPALVTRPENLERAVFETYADFRKQRRV